MALDLEAQSLEKLGRGLAVPRAIARWIVGRHAHQGLQKLGLAGEIALDEIAHGLNRSMNLVSAATARPMSATLANSAGL